MTAPATLVLAFLFGSGVPSQGDAACDRIREKERHAYCHCLTANGGKVQDETRSTQLMSALRADRGAQANVMSCMERRGFGV